MVYRRQRGYTLIEVLVASGIFVFLGVALVALMRQGISIWQTAEKRGRIYERARSVLDTVASDLRSMATDSRPDGAGFWIRCLCDLDENGRQRLRFVRSLPGEVSDPVARYGGEFLTHDDSTYYDQKNDLAEVESGSILPTGGYQEVLYTLAPEGLAGHLEGLEEFLEVDPTAIAVWRGVRSPVGGTGTLFSDRNISTEIPKGGSSSPRSTGRSARGGSTDRRAFLEQRQEEIEAEREARRAPLARVARPLLADVLHLGFSFWTPATNTWDTRHPPLRQRSRTRPSGPSLVWDSTRALLTERERSSGQFAFVGKDESLFDPDDDIFPRRIQVTVVIRGSVDVPNLELGREVSAGDRTIWLTRTAGLPPEGHLRIGQEWIRYDSISGDALSIGKEGRGVRGTKAAAHDILAPVEFGTTFTRVVEIPTHSEPLKSRASSRAASSRRRL